MTSDWRGALDIYVIGRNRALTVDEKRSAVTVKSSGVPGVSSFCSSTTDTSTFGIPVPRTLEFYRNAGTWRDRLDGARQHEAGSGD